MKKESKRESDLARYYRMKEAGICVRCKKQPTNGTVMCLSCVEKRKQTVKPARQKTYAKIRGAAYEAYGNKCACCGETEQSFFTLDHINNDGSEHRKGLTTNKPLPGYRIYYWLRDNGYPEGFQILCGSCHISKTRLGTCVHQLKGPTDENVY